MYYDHLEYWTASTHTISPAIYLYSRTSPLLPWQSTPKADSEGQTPSFITPMLPSVRRLASDFIKIPKVRPHCHDPFLKLSHHSSELSLLHHMHFIPPWPGSSGDPNHPQPYPTIPEGSLPIGPYTRTRTLIETYPISLGDTSDLWDHVDTMWQSHNHALPAPPHWQTP